MFWLNRNRMRLVVVGIVAVMVLSGGSAKADFTFGTPKNLGPTVNSEALEYSHCLSSDGLELYFGSNREGGHGSVDIWVSTRETTEDEWGSPENLGPVVNSSNEDMGVSLSTDGLELYFQSWRSNGLGRGDIWVTKRAARGEPWSEPINLGPTVNSELDEYNPCLSADGLELYFVFGEWDPQDGPAHLSLGMTKRETKDDPWGESVNLGPVVNDWPCQDTPWISSDSRLLMFADIWKFEPRPDGFGDTDIWFCRRATQDGDWGEPVNLGPAINTVFAEDFPMISADGTTLYFNSNHCGTLGRYDIWQASILPVADFDDDGTVGMNDLLMMIESWGTDNTLFDIGPMPWGDGLVNEADLEILMDHWGQDMYTPTEPLAHWTLDEAEGPTAHDRSGIYDADLLGDPVWLSSAGMVGGALELDGNGDYIKTPFIVTPTEGSFSFFAWVKGGNPGQVIISDKLRFNWLTLDLEGNLATPIMGVGAGGTIDVLYSQAQVTDGQWHHVGLVWDFYPANRILYVDGVEVARDVTSGNSGVSYMGHYIGASWGLHSSGYWSGLIDDVRIYEGALSAEEIVDLTQ
jgi:hypothetical protein